MYGLAAVVCLFAVGLPITEAKVFWSSSPSPYNDLIRNAYPVGNGKLAGMPFGDPGQDKVNLNVDTLWTGGPFESSTYKGDLPSSSRVETLNKIRNETFTKGTGSMGGMLGSKEFYGTYRVLANLSVAIGASGAASGYNRSLDLVTGIHSTSYRMGDAQYNSSLFCSFPDGVCVYRVHSDQDLPTILVNVENQFYNSTTQNSTCGNDLSRLTGFLQTGNVTGQQYHVVARVASPEEHSITCNDGTLTIKPNKNTNELVLVIGAATNYDQKKGSAADNYSFKGRDPRCSVDRITKEAAGKSYEELLARHTKDFTALTGAFTLDLPDVQKTSGTETAKAIDAYSVDAPGDPYVDSLLFDYGRYLLISSARENSLPANLQGKWTEELTPAWKSDYHPNINLQMNYWSADQTGLGGIQQGLWDYMADTWVPRGTEAAEIIYGAPGWVVHNQLNIYGHAGLTSKASWANYPVAPAWMMQHVFDHFQYSQELTWFKTQGYPLLKPVAQFWLANLVEDGYFKDGTLVVNPCNSPELGPTTFACTHFQHLVHQLLDFTLTSARAVGEADTSFLQQLEASASKIDKGIHIGSWGQLKEWKIPDSLGYDVQNNTHRHISQLVGWFPGYSVASFAQGSSNATIRAAIETTLWSRGDGYGLGDGDDPGWAKVWRAGCWARLGNAERAYHHVRLAIDRNFVGNGLSMYYTQKRPFQIDANLGFPGAMLAMLVTDLPMSYADEGIRMVVLGPAIPGRWAGGSVKGLRLRGGAVVDFSWGDEGVVDKVEVVSRGNTAVRIVDKAGKLLVEI